jgi:hypothetical protein
MNTRQDLIDTYTHDETGVPYPRCTNPECGHPAQIGLWGDYCATCYYERADKRQQLIDTYIRYERELMQAEANVRRLRNRMMRLAVQLVGTEDAPTRRTQGRRIPVTFAQKTKEVAIA